MQPSSALQSVENALVQSAAKLGLQVNGTAAVAQAIADAFNVFQALFNQYQDRVKQISEENDLLKAENKRLVELKDLLIAENKTLKPAKPVEEPEFVPVPGDPEGHVVEKSALAQLGHTRPTRTAKEKAPEK